MGGGGGGERHFWKREGGEGVGKRGGGGCVGEKRGGGVFLHDSPHPGRGGGGGGGGVSSPRQRKEEGMCENEWGRVLNVGKNWGAEVIFTWRGLTSGYFFYLWTDSFTHSQRWRPQLNKNSDYLEIKDQLCRVVTYKGPAMTMRCGRVWVNVCISLNASMYCTSETLHMQDIIPVGSNSYRKCINLPTSWL